MKKDTIKLLLIFTPALFGSFPALANVSGSDWKPQIVEKMLILAENARQELGEYGQRGSGQRATGSAISNAPIVTNEQQDWEKVDQITRESIKAEWIKRYPEKVRKFNK